MIEFSQAFPFFQIKGPFEPGPDDESLPAALDPPGRRDSISYADDGDSDADGSSDNNEGSTGNSGEDQESPFDESKMTQMRKQNTLPTLPSTDNSPLGSLSSTEPDGGYASPSVDASPASGTSSDEDEGQWHSTKELVESDDDSQKPASFVLFPRRARSPTNRDDPHHAPLEVSDVSVESLTDNSRAEEMSLSGDRGSSKLVDQQEHIAYVGRVDEAQRVVSFNERKNREVERSGTTKQPEWKLQVPENEEEGDSRLSSRCRCIIYVVGCALALSMIIGIVILLKHLMDGSVNSDDLSFEPEDELKEQPKDEPKDPSGRMVLIRQKILPLVPQSTVANLEDEFSPQSRAMRWLLNIDEYAGGISGEQRYESTPDRILAERFAMATVYYALQGPVTSDDNKWLPYFLTGESICTWHESPLGSGVHCGSFGSVLRLEIDPSNYASGSLPDEIGLFRDLEELVIHSNYLGGMIPSTLGFLRRLKRLYMPSNNFVGRIPSELGVLSNLYSVDLWQNYLTGSLPNELDRLSRMSSFDVSNNALSGSLPSSFMLSWTSLRRLSLYHNHITGQVPPLIGNLHAMLQRVDLDFNELTGSLPSELGLLTNLQTFYASFNELTGVIPSELENASRLRSVLLSNNGIAGTVPAGMSAMSQLSRLELHGNLISGNLDLILCREDDLSQSLLQLLTADCLGDDNERSTYAQINCACCTTCCSRETGQCQGK